MTRTRIKICGFTREADIAAAVAAGADAVGLNRYAKSARFVSRERMLALARELPPFVTPVLLYVNAPLTEIEADLAELPHALLQFHGDETAAECDAAGRAYLRAVRMAPGTDLLDCAARFPRAMALLLDAHVEGYGGGGKSFDWSLIPPSVARTVVLSGGLNPANVIDGVLRVRPLAVDVSSGVEASKGVKDAVLMHRFCQAVRQADDRLASEPGIPA